MVETLKTNSNLLETSNTAKEWTEQSQNSKLNNIKSLINNSNNENVKRLSDLIKKREYKKFQKEIWATPLDGKLWAWSFDFLKAYENKEQQINTQLSSTQNVETKLKTEITTTSTSPEAQEWTESAPKSKLNDIKELLQNSENTKIIKLSTMIENGQYTEFQQELWITPADWKLWGASLYKLETFIENALQEQMMQPGEVWNKNERKEFGKNQQRLTWNFENKSKQELWSWEWIIEKWKRKLQKWVEISENQLTLAKIDIPRYEDNMVISYEKSEKINNINIKYIGKNICINNRYVIHPQWTICFYEEKDYLNTYANSHTSNYQDSLLKPLYDYLNSNRSKFEYKYVSEPIVADGSGVHNNHFETNKTRPSDSKDYANIGMHKEKDKDGNTIWVSDPIVADGRWVQKAKEPEQKTKASSKENREWQMEIDENFPNTEIADFKYSSEVGVYIWRTIDLHISNIVKKWNTLILNNWEIEVTSTNWQISYKLNKGNESINVWKWNMWYENHDKRKAIYNKLNKEYFS